MSDYTLVFLRSTFAFTFLFLMAKLLGKKLISQMTLFDFITGITFGTLAASLSINLNENPGPIVLAIVLWTAYTFTMGLLSLKSRKARKFLEDKPIMLVQDGKILEENLAKERFNIDDLLMRLREKNVFKLSDVECAILETDGKVSVIPKSQKRALTPSDLSLSTGYEGFPIEIIVDGKIIYQNLEQVGLDVQWLKEQLAAQKVNSVEDVSFAQLTTDGQLYIDLKSDNLLTEIKVED